MIYFHVNCNDDNVCSRCDSKKHFFFQTKLWASLEFCSISLCMPLFFGNNLTNAAIRLSFLVKSIVLFYYIEISVI